MFEMVRRMFQVRNSDNYFGALLTLISITIMIVIPISVIRTRFALYAV